MKETHKFLLLSLIASAIITCLIAVSLSTITIGSNYVDPNSMLMDKISQGQMQGHKPIPMGTLIVISFLFFIGLEMVFYVAIKYKTERKK